MSDDFIINIQAFVDRAKANADLVVRKMTLELLRSLVLKSPVGNPELWESKPPPGYVGGRFRMNWQVTLQQPASGTVDDVDPSPSGSKAIAAGQQVANQAKAGDVVYVVNNLPYAHRLEFESWSSQAPAGMLRVTVAEFNQFLTAAVRQLPEK